MKLLTRTEFREAVFKRDNHKCVIHKDVEAVDAHHIMERRLFTDKNQFGGYFLQNGASLCSACHIKAEQTLLSCEVIREAAGITEIILPNHLYDDNDYTYDKWANIILPSGMRLKGELFFDESVQKILEPVLNEFHKYVKYPRTMHLPWSEKLGKDDRVMDSMDYFMGKEIIVTAKLDGENTSLYNDFTHARSINSGAHDSRKWIKELWSHIAYDIPEGWRLCGENLFAVHTIKYSDLESYFYLFSIWNEKNECLSWDETLEWYDLLNSNTGPKFKFATVPVLYRGIYDEDTIKSFNESYYKDVKNEGYVVRLTESFKYSEFRKSIAKFVSGNFEIKHGHWSQQKIEKNKLV
jgi:hypothetical protein